MRRGIISDLPAGNHAAETHLWVRGLRCHLKDKCEVSLNTPDGLNTRNSNKIPMMEAKTGRGDGATTVEPPRLSNLILANRDRPRSLTVLVYVYEDTMMK
jgi:hypothetical protein